MEKLKLLTAVCAMFVAAAATAQTDGAGSTALKGRISVIRTGDKRPLVLIRTADGNGFTAGSLDTIKPERIESLSILKDATADEYDTYGDTSNGVMVVRLKNGATETRADSLVVIAADNRKVIRKSEAQPLVILQRDGVTAVAASLDELKADGIKAMSIIKDSASTAMFSKYGNTSKGVIVVELRDGVKFPAGAHIVIVRPDGDDAGGETDRASE